MKRIAFCISLVCSLIPLIAGAEMSEGLYPNGAVGFWSFDFGSRTELPGAAATAASGLYIETGVNFGKFFHPRLVVSPMVGIAPAWGGKFSASFMDQINTHYRLPQAYESLITKSELTEAEQDELWAYETGIARMDLLRTNNPEGAFAFYYGLMFRYPHRYAPLMKVYALYYSTNMGSTSTGWVDSSSGTSVQGARSIERSGWGAELILFRGYTLVSTEGMGQFNLGSISLFFETLDLKTATIYQNGGDDAFSRTVYLHEFLDPDFFNTYGRETKIGIKIGFNLM